MAGGERCRLLLVEDDPGDALLIESALANDRGLDGSAVRVGTLGEAAAALSRAAFDAILLDASLADGRGTDALEEILAATDGTPIVLLMDGEDQRPARLAVGKGSWECVPKSAIAAGLLGRSLHYVIERKRIESRLKEKERLLEASERIAGVGGWEYVAATHTSTWTDGLYALYGVPRDFPISDFAKITAFFPGDAHEEVARLFERALTTGEGFDVRCPFVNAQGKRLWVRLTAEPVLVGGQVVKLRGNMVDVTAAAPAQEAVERERHRLLSLLEQLPHFAYLVASDYGVRFANRRFVELFGEVDGKTCYQLLHGSEVPCSRCETLDVLRTGESDVQLWTTPEGRVYRLFDTRLEVPGGEDVVLEVGMDVTESRRVERVLHLTRHSVDSASISIFWITPDGRFTFANETAHRSLGYSAEGMRGKGVWDIDPEYPRDQRAAQWERIRNEGMIVFESTHRRLDGTIIPVEITSQYLEFEGDEYELAFATDISERELAEAERRALEAELRQVQKLESIGTFASGIAHEINNPLMGMINYAELISTRVKDPRLKEFAEEIKSEGDRVAGIVRNLLFFARQETEHHSPARIADIAAAALSIMGALLRKEGITVEVDVPDDLPEVFCRSQQIQQVLINLLTNARDALNSRYPHSDPNKSIRIVSRVVEDAGVKWVRTTVEDHGIGIPAEIVDRVFDPFFTTKPRDRGTGLGLSISYGIVRDHEGQLWIEGVPGEETRVHMDLPLPEAVS